MTELKPCPFCGGTDRVRSVAYAGTSFEPEDPRWHVGCTACDAGVDGLTKSESIAIWNTRTFTKADVEAVAIAVYQTRVGQVLPQGHELPWDSINSRDIWRSLAHAALSALGDVEK